MGAVGLKRKKAAYMAVQGEDAMIRCPPQGLFILLPGR